MSTTLPTLPGPGDTCTQGTFEAGHVPLLSGRGLRRGALLAD